MEPQTTRNFDAKTLRRLFGTVGAMSKASRDPHYVAPVPVDIGIELTNRCNQRCLHCFLWNEQGLYQVGEQKNQRHELAWEVLDKLLRDTEATRSKLFFWGTEPLLYSQFDKLAERLEQDPRWTVMCTNGTLIERRLPALLRMSENLAVVVSLDGPQEEHDYIRGPGAFDSAMRGVRRLQEEARAGRYKGLVSLHCVMHEALVPKLYDFALWAEQQQVDSLYLGFPWYIPETVALRMDAVVRDELPFLEVDLDRAPLSWHTYTHHLPPSCLPELREQIKLICGRTWSMRFRFQPALEDHELEDFVLGGELPAQKRTRCHAVQNRMDIRATGKVTSCQCYPELVVGDLNTQPVDEVWHGERMKGVRGVLREGLMPVCSKCILLYLNGS